MFGWVPLESTLSSNLHFLPFIVLHSSLRDESPTDCFPPFVLIRTQRAEPFILRSSVTVIWTPTLSSLLMIESRLKTQNGFIQLLLLFRIPDIMEITAFPGTKSSTQWTMTLLFMNLGCLKRPPLHLFSLVWLKQRWLIAEEAKLREKHCCHKCNRASRVQLTEPV